jgi:hypothetical protein
MTLIMDIVDVVLETIGLFVLIMISIMVFSANSSLIVQINNKTFSFGTPTSQQQTAITHGDSSPAINIRK